jgi:hypothetical protein
MNVELAPDDNSIQYRIGRAAQLACARLDGHRLLSRAVGEKHRRDFGPAPAITSRVSDDA